jgi:hypothetical protein
LGLELPTQHAAALRDGGRYGVHGVHGLVAEPLRSGQKAAGGIGQ